MKKLTYSCLIKMRESALWATEAAAGNQLYALALRYYRILNYVEDRMRNFKIAG